MAMDNFDRKAIHDAVYSFRKGAPILIDDIRFACEVDGNSIRHLPTFEVVQALSEVCVPEHRGSHQRALWRRYE